MTIGCDTCATALRRVAEVDVHLVDQLAQLDFHVIFLDVFPLIIFWLLLALLEAIFVLVFILDLLDGVEVRLLLQVDAAAQFRVGLEFVDERHFVFVDHAVVIEPSEFELLFLFAFEVAFDEVDILLITGFVTGLFEE